MRPDPCVSGTDYHSQAKLLRYFDRFVAKQHLSEPRITPPITQAYQQSLSQLAPRTQHNRFGVLTHANQNFVANWFSLRLRVSASPRE